MPPWLWIALGGVLLLCLIAVIVAALVLKDSWLPSLRGEDQATPTEDVAPTATPTLTEAAPPTEEPTPPPTETLSPALATFTITLELTTSQLNVNDIFAATVIVTNTGDIDISNLVYKLTVVEGGSLLSDQPLEFSHPGPIQAGNTDRGEFYLRAIETGLTKLQACVTVAPSLPVCSNTIVVQVR